MPPLRRSCGDEGLGFKIGAKEVKALANETAEAAEKISTRTGSVAEEVLFASGDLSRHAKTLREIVDGFVAKISLA